MNTRTSKLIFPAILFLFACLIAFGENGPTPQIIVGSSGISDGSVTNAKLAEPVSVANGGTGATTAAAGLAALGGASLNGSSTVGFLAKSLSGQGHYISGFRWVAAAGQTVQVATITVPVYSGCKITVIAGGVEDNVGDGVIERTIKISRTLTDPTLADSTVVWGTSDFTAELTQDSTASGVVRIWLAAGANTIDLVGSFEAKGTFSGPSVWSY